MLLLGADAELTVAGHWGLRPRDVPAGVVAQAELAALTSARPVLAGPAAEVGVPAWLERYRARQAAWARLLAGDESLGVLLIVRRGEIPFEASEEKELQAVAARLGLAVENGLLHQRMTAQIAQLSRMDAITVDLACTLEVAAVAQRVADAVVAEAEVGASAVLLDGPDPVATSAHAAPEAGWSRLPIETAAGRIGQPAVRDLPPRASEPRDRLEHLLGLAGLALEKAMLYERGREQARRDSLTGLLAHRPFHEALAALEEQGSPSAS